MGKRARVLELAKSGCLPVFAHFCLILYFKRLRIFSLFLLDFSFVRLPRFCLRCLVDAVRVISVLDLAKIIIRQWCVELSLIKVLSFLFCCEDWWVLQSLRYPISENWWVCTLVLKVWCCVLLWLLTLLRYYGVLRHHVLRGVPHEQLLVWEGRRKRVL